MQLAALPNWIQAASALCLVALTVLTLIVLRGYASDTKKIAQATENSQTPFLAVAMREGDEHGQGGWTIENQGFGPAINISFSDYRDGSRFMRPVPSLAPGGVRRNLHNQIAHALGQPGGVEIEYESLAGSRYRTTVTTENGHQSTRFRRI